MSNDWSVPVDSTTYTAVLAALNNKIISAAKQDYTGDTNIPTNVLAFNVATGEVTQYNGSAFVSVLACYKSGDIKMTFAATPDAGFLMLNGDTVGDGSSGAMRANAAYANLFAALWNNLANGEGPVSGGRGASAAADFAAHKTITMPDARQRVPVYVGAAGTINAPGKLVGSFDHTHGTPNHQHTIASHVHDMNSHTHIGTAHAHIGGAHQHNVPGHNHSVAATGATIAISGGSHNHGTLGRNMTAGIDHTASGRVANSGGAGSPTTDSGPSVAATHTHPNGEFSGLVGLVTAGVSGDAAFTTVTNGVDGAVWTASQSSGASAGPSVANTLGSGTLTSNTGEGAATTSTSNGPMISMYFQIKT